MAFTKVVGAGIHTLSNITSHNINSSGIITATKFVGPFDGSSGDFSGNVTIDGNLTVNGTTTKLDTQLVEVDKIEVDTAGSNVAVAVTHAGSGDLLRLHDGTSQVVTVDDQGNVGLGSAIPAKKLDVNGTSQFQDDVTFIDGWGYGNHVFYNKSNTTLTFPSASLTNVAQVPTLTFGDRTSGGNFKIYNDWYTTHLRQVGDGGLTISSLTNHIQIAGANGSGGVQQSIRIDAGATEGVKIYNGGNLKFETVGYGVTVYGTTETQKLNVTGISTFSSVINANQGILLTDSDNKSILLGESDDMRIRHTGSHSEITDEGQGSLRLGGNNIVIGSATFGATMATFAQGGAVNLYHNDERTAFTGQDAFYVYGRTSNSGMIEIASNQGANNNDRFRIHKTSAGQRLSIQNYASGSWVENIRITAGGLVELKHADGTTKMHTDTTGITVANRITASGDTNTYINVGSSEDTLDFYTGGINYFRLNSDGNLLVNKLSTSDYGKFEVRGGTADNIETADITAKTVATFSGSTPGTTAAGKGAGIVIKPISNRGCNYFIGVANDGTNQEAHGRFIIRSGNQAGTTSERLRINSSGEVQLSNSLVVGGTSFGGAGTFSVGSNGSFRSVLASSSASDTLLGAISGVSNGLQINVAGDNGQTYTFHNGSAVSFRIDTSGRIRTDGGTQVSDFDVTRSNSTITDVMLVKGNTGNGFIRFQDNDLSCNFTLGADDGAGLGANSFILYDRVNSAYRWSIDNSGNMRVNNGNIHLLQNGKELTWGSSQQMKFFYDNSEQRMYLQGDGAYGFAFRINSGNRIEIDKTTGDVTMQGASGRNFQWDNSEASLYLTDNGSSSSARLKVGSGGDLQLYHDTGGANHITCATNQELKLSANYFSFYDYSGVTQRFKIDSNGHVTITATSYEALTIKTNNNGTNGPEISLFHNTASPAVSDVIGQLRYTGRDSAGDITLYSKIETKVSNVTNGSETGHIDFSTRGGGAYNSIFRLNARSTASAPNYTTDDMNGIILDTYNTGNPYPRYMNFIAKSAGNTSSNIDFWTETVGGSPIDRLRIDNEGSLRTMNKGGYWQITAIHDGDGSGNWLNGTAPQRIYPNYIDNNTGYAEFYMTFHPSTSYSGYGEPTLVIRGGNYLQTTGEIAISYNGRTNSPSSGVFRALHAQYQWMIYNDGDTDAYSGMRSINRYTQNKTSQFVDDTTHTIDYIASNDGRYGTNSEPIIDQRSYIKIKINGVGSNNAIQGHTVFCKFTCYTGGDKEWKAYMYYN